MFSGLGNVLIGGDGFAYYYYPLTFPENLTVTNLYWNYLPAIYSLNLAPGAVTRGGMIILYGGTDGTSSTSAVIGYSPSGDAPLTLASMSVPRSYLGYAPDRNGNAYAIGGLDDTGQPLASAERYNPDADTWTAIAPLPAARYNFPAVFNGTNQIYIFGGRTNATAGAEIATVLRYSVNANTWTAVAPMPVATAGSAAALGVDGKFYVVGGVSGGVATSVVQVYNPTANTWEFSTPLPEALSASAMGVDSLGRLIVMGGMDINGNDVGDVWRSQQLGVPDSAPVFTQYPGTNGIYLTAYASSIIATGSPPPTYLLWSGPTGMQVDPFSGAITWTPQGLAQIGTIPATIRATNYAGYADWSFIINVPNPPPALVTNLTVVGVTENSVTLSWAPEDPVAGSVTYSVWLRHILHSPKGSGVTIWYTQIGSSTTVPTITITGLTPGLSQTYYVVASGPGGTSGYAGISATTLSVQPPINIRVTGLTSTSITLAWDSPPGPVPAASYQVWGWINNGVTSAIYGSGITQTTLTITGLVPASIHEWGVRAYDAEGFPSAFDYGPTVMNPLPVAVKASGATGLPGGNFQFTAYGASGQTAVVETTTNPADPTSWILLTSFLPPSSSFVIIDTNPPTAMRFYRVSQP
ncbi:MAG TPA: kelch repeat-containing protein [Candidatus Acidoferrum sp.]|nr:kelch repeat-containing protein [Candidatus Acidoferrum sp.]